ncbi:hypothetical protein [Rhodococcus kronopolitis]|uniref:Uncharacterized protein n=1 Tax=Rhodococcus kronopolitis TaxID=1460226 RepID=A0ABV9FVH2_9NOCA
MSSDLSDLFGGLSTVFTALDGLSSGSSDGGSSSGGSGSLSSLSAG